MRWRSARLRSKSFCESLPSFTLLPPAPRLTRLVTSWLNASLRSGVASSAATLLRALIIPQPMSKPTRHGGRA
jgi:hypothetical protein